MNLIIDIGNTNIKVYVYYNGKPEFFKIINSIDKLKNSIIGYSEKISHVIISDVKSHGIENILSIFEGKFILLVKECRLPFESRYKTMNSLGDDRIALVNSAFKKFPNHNVLIIDVGTCITYDLIVEKGYYLGGMISPGFEIRYRSLNLYTANLPLVKKIEKKANIIGDSTHSSIESGVYFGIINEINLNIDFFLKNYRNLKVVVTGGDSKVLFKKIKNAIFADQYFLADGLNYLLEFNKTK
tara:strand:- start:65966 stop:66691 length:726 start_codon:yes stop_codon:yes gene_type:complete